MPPVHDSPTAIRLPVQQLSDLLLDLAAVEREDGVRVPVGDRRDKLLGQRLVGRLAANRDLQLAAPQAGRDLQLLQIQLVADARAASPRSRTPAGRTGAACASCRPGAPSIARPEQVGLDRLRPALLQLARRARQHHDGLVAGRHHQPGRRPDRIERDGALGHHRLLAVGDRQRLGVDPPAPREARHDLADAALEVLVELQRPAREAGHDLGRHVVGGRAQARRW